MRSAMFVNPDPGRVLSGSNPRPSSATEKERNRSSVASRTTIEVAAAYLATFWKASRQQKYASGAFRLSRRVACPVTLAVAGCDAHSAPT
jgi:hypothetical protein